MISLIQKQLRTHILTVAGVIMLASIVYSTILLETTLTVVKKSESSILDQQLNPKELSTALGSLQLNLNRYIVSRHQTALDSIKFYEKSYRTQADILYKLTRNNPELEQEGKIIYANSFEIIKKIDRKLKRLPNTLTVNVAVEFFNEDSNSLTPIWRAVDKIRSYQISSIKRSTKDTVTAGVRSWNVSILGSIFLLLVVFSGYFYIRKGYKKEAISEAKEVASEAIRKENEKLLHAVIDNCTANIFLKDKNLRYTLVNKSLKQAFELKNEDIIGKLHNEVFAKTQIQHLLMGEDQILKTGETQEFTAQILHRNQQIRYYLTNKFPLIGEGGEIFGVGGISTDITEQREYENDLMQARELAEAAKISQQWFLANMSHEIRTPMNGVIGMTNLLEATTLNAEQQDYVKVIRQSSNILMLLINDILDVSKMQAGMLKLEKIPFEVRESIKQIFLSYKPMAHEMGIILNCDVDAATPEFLLGDPLRLNQIISNLVNNAIKFTSSGSVSIKVTSTQKETDIFNLKIDVIDTGIGIPADKLEDVFKSFTQSSTSTTRKYGGTGLGLAIVKELVEMQNGTVHLKSELSLGSTFTVVIPFPLAVVDKVQQQKNHGSQKFAALKDKKILVVEDNLINQKVARQILLNAGLGLVDIADNGFKALDMLQKEAYDAVLMDVHMPEIDGLETTRRIRNVLKLSLPVIALTASALAEDREICIEAGMNEYITKPFLPEDLLQKLSGLL